jgi:hypothetical protein
LQSEQTLSKVRLSSKRPNAFGTTWSLGKGVALAVRQ